MPDRKTRLVCMTDGGELYKISRVEFTSVVTENLPYEYLKGQASAKLEEIKRLRDLRIKIWKTSDPVGKLDPLLHQYDKSKPNTETIVDKSATINYEEVFQETIESHLHPWTQPQKRLAKDDYIKNLLKKINNEKEEHKSELDLDLSSTSSEEEQDMFNEEKYKNQNKRKFFSVQKEFQKGFTKAFKRHMDHKTESNFGKGRNTHIKDDSNSNQVSQAISLFFRKKQKGEMIQKKNKLIDRLQGVLADWDSKFICNLQLKDESILNEQIKVVKSMCKQP